MPLLTDGPERERHVQLLQSAAERADWARVIEGLLSSYRQAIGSPYRAAAPRAWQELGREQIIQDLDKLAQEYQTAYHDLRASVGIGLPLVAEGGLLSRDEQQGLMRVASRPVLHKVILMPIALLGRLGSAESL